MIPGWLPLRFRDLPPAAFVVVALVVVIGVFACVRAYYPRVAEERPMLR